MQTLTTTPEITLDDVLSAQKRLEGSIIETSACEAPGLSELAGCTVLCKREYLQRTGSFKERGAANALEQLSASGNVTGVIAASAGNHALGLASHGRRLGIPVTVVMPRFAPLV